MIPHHTYENSRIRSPAVWHVPTMKVVGVNDSQLPVVFYMNQLIN
jgi:hypothetical protein